MMMGYLPPYLVYVGEHRLCILIKPLIWVFCCFQQNPILDCATLEWFPAFPLSGCSSSVFICGCSLPCS